MLYFVEVVVCIVGLVVCGVCDEVVYGVCIGIEFDVVGLFELVDVCY